MPKYEPKCKIVHICNVTKVEGTICQSTNTQMCFIHLFETIPNPHSISPQVSYKAKTNPSFIFVEFAFAFFLLPIAQIM